MSTNETIGIISHNANVISFCKTQLPKILKIIGIREYKIGGSVGAAMWNAFGNDRAFHDIDVIVPKSVISSIKEHLKENPLISETKTSLGSPTDPDDWCEDFTTHADLNHFAFTMANCDYTLDLIEDITSNKFNGYHICSIEDLIRAKKKYKRNKDKKDLEYLYHMYALLNGHEWGEQ